MKDRPVDSPVPPATGAYVGGARLRFPTVGPRGRLVEMDGRPYYRLENVDTMPPFLMSVVSDTDHWMFVSSNGALTAGRWSPDGALFPYETDDRIHDSRDRTGGRTVVRVRLEEGWQLWEPFSDRYEGLWQCTRTLLKGAYGNEVVFEEANADLGLVFSCSWGPSDRFGFVRRCSIRNEGRKAVGLEILDGVQNLLPAGLTRRFQSEYSTLADAYKESELSDSTGLGLFRFSSIPTDRAEPNEALAATTVWYLGPEPTARLLCSDGLDLFRRGGRPAGETFVRGRRGAYFVCLDLGVPADGRAEWLMAADVHRGPVEVRDLAALLADPGALSTQVRADLDRGTERLVGIVAGSDGLQLTNDPLGTRRHYSNVLYNVMRGGTPNQGYTVECGDFAAFVAACNHTVHGHQGGLLGRSQGTVQREELLRRARASGNADLERLALVYLPFTFSRRHGDPSRPWNAFELKIRDERGRRIAWYEGNWRDIFQNWEALALSYPGYLPGMIAKFLCASTADGHNPYRLTKTGFEWEVPEPKNPWSNIGYWGDHQVVYLLRLLELEDRYHPGQAAKTLNRRVYTYADVPYRIRPYDAMMQDPRRTIDFDGARDTEIRRRVERMGAEGAALPGSFLAGGPYRASLMEKLLVTVLAKLSSYVPAGGIWMNTQRPEWNDANNALVGVGLSVVTLCYLRRLVSFLRGLLRDSSEEEFDVAAVVGQLLREVVEVLAGYRPDDTVTDVTRAVVLERLGTAGSRYRAAVYTHGLGGQRLRLDKGAIDGFLGTVLGHLDSTIRGNRRGDGLYHAYNLMVRTGSGIAIGRLDEMLEGQVAVLNSGILTAEECLAVLDALRASALYREDQSSYLLYPDRRLPRFLEKNNLPPPDAEGQSPLLPMLADGGGEGIVVRDREGGLHFGPRMRNAEALRAAIRKCGEGSRARAQETYLLDLYERVFDHSSFAGRSGAMYKYEGLGCVYWHMVSKLLVAVQEVSYRALAVSAPQGVVGRILAHYREIREGTGAHKRPDVYGAVPIDPYSHTPSFAGAQQPGMTGQVKEDILTRPGELGLRVELGCIRFVPELVSTDEPLRARDVFRYVDLNGRSREIALDAGDFAFTCCQVPVVVHASGPGRVDLYTAGGNRTTIQGHTIPVGPSAQVFDRAGSVERIEVYLGGV